MKKNKNFWSKKGFLALILALLMGLSLVGCGNTNTEDPSDENSSSEGTETSEYARELKYRRMPTATSDLFEGGVVPILERMGYTLTPVEITDSIQRELSLSEGEIDLHVDANTAYLDAFNEQYGANNVGVLEIPTVPTGIYSGYKTDLADIAVGDQIAFPNDAANEARSLYLLETLGWVKMKEGLDKSKYTLLDIEENVYDLDFVEMSGGSIPAVREDFAFIILRGSDAYNGKVDFNSALARESDDSILAASRMVLAVDGDNQDEGWVQDVIAAYQSDEFKEYIASTGDFWILPDYLKD